MIATRDDYEHALTALGICISARIPVLLWGNPGEGKTAVVESARASDWHVETLIVSHYEPSDFAGLPLIGDGATVTLAPPAWATRLATHDGPSIAFFDEFSTASPALQAAALRPLTHYEVGSLQLPETVSFVAAANPTDVAAAGWELAAPTASRFVHLDWGLPLEVYSECLVTGEWPTIPVHPLPEGYAVALTSQRVMVSGYLRARSAQLSSIPKTAADRGRAFPTPRTWDYLSRLLALADLVGAPRAVHRLLASGCIGAADAHEYLRWAQHQDLPDPDDVLAAGTGARFAGYRPDQVYVILQGVLAAVVRDNTPTRWSAAIEVCSSAADQAGLDPAVPVIRALLRGSVRPAGAHVPPAIKVFAPALSLAGLLAKS